MIDSFGKPKSGILEGSVFWLGDYDECVSINIKSLDFQGRYCRVADPSASELVKTPLLFI